MRRSMTVLVASGLAALSLAACTDHKANDAAIRSATLSEHNNDVAPVPGMGSTVSVPRTGTMSSGTDNSDVAIGAPPPGKMGTNAH